jgi:F0F1-type ATP synthase assembly protein I
MKKTAAKPTTTPPAPDHKNPISDLKIIQSFADTTWRIAVPVVGLTLIGIYIDKHHGTKPWLTLAGSIVGFIIAGLLVKRQIAAITGGGDDE